MALLLPCSQSAAQSLRQHSLQQPPPLLIGLAELLLQLVAEGHQFIHLGDDAVLLGEGWEGISILRILPTLRL